MISKVKLVVSSHILEKLDFLKTFYGVTSVDQANRHYKMTILYTEEASLGHGPYDEKQFSFFGHDPSSLK